MQVSPCNLFGATDVANVFKRTKWHKQLHNEVCLLMKQVIPQNHRSRLILSTRQLGHSPSVSHAAHWLCFGKENDRKLNPNNSSKQANSTRNRVHPEVRAQTTQTRTEKKAKLNSQSQPDSANTFLSSKSIVRCNGDHNHGVYFHPWASFCRWSKRHWSMFSNAQHTHHYTLPSITHNAAQTTPQYAQHSLFIS